MAGAMFTFENDQASSERGLKFKKIYLNYNYEVLTVML